MNTLSNITSLLTHSLAWALLYSLWQGALIYGSLYLPLKALPNAGARAKYYLSFGALTATCLWFADTWSAQYQKLKGVTVFITQSAPDGGLAKTFTINTAAAIPVHDTTIHHLLPRMEQYFPLILMLYAAGLAFMLCRFAINILQLHALKTTGIIVPGEEWQRLLQCWQNKFEIARPVKLYFSKRINTPMMLGALKPIILLPLAAMNHLSTDQVEAILMHELAHIKRHDYLLNIFQTIAETILFFNPFVWLISGIIRMEREHCCDDMVVSCTASPLPYARALAILESNRMASNNELVLAATGQKNQLLQRIKRIMEMKKNNINYGQLTIIVVAILAITFSIALFTFTPSFAQKAKGDAGDTTTKTKSVYKFKSVTIDSNGKKTEVVKESDKPIKDMSEEGDNVDVSITDDSSKNMVKTYRTFTKVRTGGDDSGGKSNSISNYSYSYSYSKDDSSNIDEVMNKVFNPVRHASAAIVYNEVESELEKINDVDWYEVSAEIKNGLAEVEKALKDERFDSEKFNGLKKILEMNKKELELDKEEMIKSMQMQAEVRAKAGNANATAKAGDDEGSTDYEAMLTKMEQDKLIDRSQSYKVSKENGTLYINGEKQPATVYNKYSQYLQDKSINIKGHKGSLSISADY